MTVSILKPPVRAFSSILSCAVVHQCLAGVGRTGGRGRACDKEAVALRGELHSRRVDGYNVWLYRAPSADCLHTAAGNMARPVARYGLVKVG